ncbi:hypothetical protein [Bradyrhizobium sp. USDA 10063]
MNARRRLIILLTQGFNEGCIDGPTDSGQRRGMSRAAQDRAVLLGDLADARRIADVGMDRSASGELCEHAYVPGRTRRTKVDELPMQELSFTRQQIKRHWISASQIGRP